MERDEPVNRSTDVCCDTCWGYDDRHPCICPGSVDPTSAERRLLVPDLGAPAASRAAM